LADEEDATFSCSNCCDREVALDCRRDMARDEWRDKAAEVLREAAGEGGAGRDDVSEVLWELDRAIIMDS